MCVDWVIQQLGNLLGKEVDSMIRNVKHLVYLCETHKKLTTMSNAKSISLLCTHNFISINKSLL
jgi:hypothetical protein